MLGLACATSSRSAPLATTPAGGKALTTDRAVYVATRERGDGGPGLYRFTVVATYANRSGAPVYLQRCNPDDPNPIYALQLVGAGPVGGPRPWRVAYDPIWACGGHDRPIVVRPGQARVDTLRLVDTHQDGVIEGRFQLSYQARSCAEAVRCPLPDLYYQRSNVFEVRLRR
jgi:hypothetical protein